ncbi:MAG: hypothetical protein IKW10_00760 [Oscillospiraceae bacterium]|nr:hypothetical protein [Oscillospiraceae bacterium]
MTVLEFIDKNFPLSILENKEDLENRFGLPYPYTVPSPGDIFDCMFYWDTHFTNVGLIPSGRMQQAIYNTDNIRYMIQRFGYMPNGTKAHFLEKSQPPVYYRMVADIFEVTQDIAWLESHYDTIAKEYDYWMTQRLAPNGLNYYGNKKLVDSEEGEGLYAYWRTRMPGLQQAGKEQTVNVGSTLGESGWDCCYRFELCGPDYNPVDLNALLYGLETAMAKFSSILKKGEDSLWRDRAANRKEKMDKWLFSKEKGFYMDWNYAENRHSPVVSAASLYPLYLGLHHNPDAIMAVLEKELLLPYGVTCTKKSDLNFGMQWEYPNIWAPLQYVAYMACQNAGRTDLAQTISSRYKSLLESNFAKTGKLWEKYDGNTGEVVSAEYSAPPMMGWTAGVYLAFLT